MITIKTSAEGITKEQLLLLNNVEKECLDFVKGLLNSVEFRHIKVALQWCVERFESKNLIISHNASFSLKGSLKMVSLISSFLENSNLNIIIPHDTLFLTLDFKEKEEIVPAQVNKKLEEETNNFLPQEPRYSFEQIILSEDIWTDIYNSLKVVECKDLIYNIWGFSQVEPIPKSILNLYGASGTGKTMCAHGIAHYLNKKILSLNYSEIESKYVGEAPKNLQKAFDVAKETDSVLFFDEADSFLGKRIQNVTQGSDQALNSLRSQMLILLEEFSGVIVFATNLVTNFDKAFESRIFKHIRFELPNQEARVAIIKKMIPNKLPLIAPFTQKQLEEASSEIDGFSGREIKVAILDMLLSKADRNVNNVKFSFDDLLIALRKKKVSKEKLKNEEKQLLKEKISKKLQEKHEEK